VALSQKDLMTQIATNEKQIAEIDSQLNKVIVDNEKKLAEIESQLSQTKLNLSYQELRAPDKGTVFDLKPSAPGFVTNTTEPMLKIVPDDGLVAKVYLTNKDIGFVKEGMPVDVRIDSFPFSEFGDVKGELVWIGSDALPPEQIRQFYSFPAKIRLQKQSLAVKGRPVQLQSGMSVSANIRVRDRTVMSIFTDLFSEKTDSLKTVR
jgi:HlyD family secretion protein